MGNFEPSPSQPVTPGQGNSCMFHALLDQLKFQQSSSLASLAASHSQLRSKLVQAAYNSVKAGKLTWPEGESVEEWRSGMVQEGTMGDQVILQAAANLFQRQIVILPVFWSAAHFPLLGSLSSVQAAKPCQRQQRAAPPCSCNTTARAG